MRKIAIFLVCIMLVTSCLLVFPIKNVKAGFGVSPPWVNEHHLLPGSHYETIIMLCQSDPSNLTYCEVTIDESEITDWITIDPSLYFPFYGMQLPMGVIIDVPENASLGNYSGSITATKIVLNQQGQVIILIGAVISISLTVIDYNYTYYEVDIIHIPDIHIGDPMRVSLTIDNQGNTYTCPPYVIVDIYDIINNFLETFNLTNWTPVAPFTRTTITKQFQINHTNGYFVHVYIPDKCSGIFVFHIRPYPFISNPTPQNGSAMVPINTVLSWSCQGVFLTYDVYFGTVNPPPRIISNQSGNFYVPILNCSTTYYWKIIAWDSLGANCIGPLWSFTTASNEPPYPPSNPYPPNNATDIPLTANLSWNGGDPNSWDTVTYDVYFGTSSNPPLQVNNQSGTTYNLGTLSYLTTYHWKIVAWDNHGASTIGAAWSFTTKVSSPPVYGTPSPHNESTGNPLQFTWSIPINDPEGDQFSWTIQCSNGQTNSGTGTTNSTKTLILSGLAYSTTYKIWVNATDPTPAGSGLYTKRWYIFTTKASLPPVFGAPTPSNGSGSQLLSFTWSIPINDPEGNQFSWTIQCSNGQTNSGTGAANGTKSLTLSGLAYSTTYKVWVNATDPTPNGSGRYTRRWYTFTTKANLPPVFGTPSPANGSTNQLLSLTWSIPINDNEGNTFTWTIQCSNGQTNSGTSATNGTKTLTLSGLVYATTYKVLVNATDPAGSNLYTRRWYILTTKGSNPPVFGIPSPVNGSTGNLLSFSWSISINDPEGDLFSWTIQCSNGQTNSSTGATNGTKTLTLSGLSYSTTYKVWINATDPTGSGLYTKRWYTFTTKANQPPDTPTITGPAQGKINVETDYNFMATDPDGDNIMYFIEWGDGTNSGWIGPYVSEETIAKSHTWTTKGTYTIKAKVKDTAGMESGYGQLSVTMPFSYTPSLMQFVMKVLARFPHAFPILRHLMGY